MDDEEVRRRFGSQLTKYLGGPKRVKQLVKECRIVGLDIGNAEIIRSIAEQPEWFSVILSYSELGLLKRMSDAIDKIKNNTKE